MCIPRHTTARALVRMSSLQRVERSTFATFNALPVLDPNNFTTAIRIILNYINFGNSKEEMVQIRDHAKAWCEDYFSTTLFARCQLTTVLERHPNMFNFAVFSRSRLDAPPPDENVMDVDMFPSYCEPSLCDDNILYQLVDMVASQQACALQFRGGNASDPYAHVRPQVSAAKLKETEIIWNLPGILASLARLNIQALEDGTGTPMFVDPPGAMVAGFQAAAAVSTARASRCQSDMSLDMSHGAGRMSLDCPPDEAATSHDMSDDSFHTVDSSDSFCTAHASSSSSSSCCCSEYHDCQMDTHTEDAGAEQEPPGEAMEGVEPDKYAAFRGYFNWLARKVIGG